jgi:hypothetical protein
MQPGAAGGGVHLPRLSDPRAKRPPARPHRVPVALRLDVELRAPYADALQRDAGGERRRPRVDADRAVEADGHAEHPEDDRLGSGRRRQRARVRRVAPVVDAVRAH